jgi:dTDP-4-amino-4,6-dideoxygalactose transaminase
LQPLYTERFGYRGGELPVTEAVATTTLALPFHGHLTDDQIDYIGTALSGAIALSRRSSAAAASLNA